MRKRASEFDFPDHVLFYSRIIPPLFEALHNTTGYFYIYTCSDEVYKCSDDLYTYMYNTHFLAKKSV